MERITVSPREARRMIAHSNYALVWDGKRYQAGCRHFTPAKAHQQEITS